MDFAELVKVYGPLSLGWGVAAYLGKFILSRYDADIDSRVKLANALDKITDRIEEARKH